MTLKGYSCLLSLINNKYKYLISEIIIGRDQNIEKDYANELIQLCIDNNLKYHDRKDTININSNYSIAISWRWLIPKSNSKLIVIHDSILPKYRGFAPLVNMLCNQEKEIGATAIFANDEYDKGDIIFTSITRIEYPIKIADAIELISENYKELINKIFSLIKDNKTLEAKPQDESKATYSLWRDNDDYLINWTLSAEKILNFINAVSYPYKGATTYINGEKEVKILNAEVFPDVTIENRDIGKVIFIKNDCPIIVCGTGLLKVNSLFDADTKEELLPLKTFRLKMTNKKTL